MSCFNKVIHGMPDVDQASVSALLTQMATGPDGGGQIVQNMLNESKLPAEYVVIILDDLKNHDDGKALRDTYERACRKCQLKGPVITCARPHFLGKAVSESRYVEVLTATGCHSDDITAKEFLDKALAAPTLDEQKERLDQTPLGRFMIWATFNERNPEQPPFIETGYTSKEWRDILAIEQDRPDLAESPLLLMDYMPGDSLALRFPTVADAEWYQYFRPTPSNSARDYGYTHSCHPAEPGRPEVVHEVVHSDLLSHPIRRVV
jgi:hypothetical protein